MLAATVAALALGAAASSAATTPCWRQVIDDWVDNDRIDQTYALNCYREAIAHVPEDLRVYSGIVEDIQAARQQASRVRRLTGNPPSTSTTSKAGKPDRAVFRQAFDKLGSRNVDTVPLPLLIMAGLSLLLIAAGAAGVVSRRLRARKVPG